QSEDDVYEVVEGVRLKNSEERVIRHLGEIAEARDGEPEESQDQHDNTGDHGISLLGRSGPWLAVNLDSELVFWAGKRHAHPLPLDPEIFPVYGGGLRGTNLGCPAGPDQRRYRPAVAAQKPASFVRVRSLGEAGDHLSQPGRTLVGGQQAAHPAQGPGGQLSA